MPWYKAKLMIGYSQLSGKKRFSYRNYCSLSLYDAKEHFSHGGTVVWIKDDPDGEERHKKREKQKLLWDRAFKNMPLRVRVISNVYWVKLEEKISVPEFIKLRAKGKIKELHPNVFAIKKTSYSHHPFGQLDALAYCLGLIGKKSVWNLRTWIRHGFELKDPIKREILEQLAGPNGKQVSWEMLTSRGIYYNAYNL